jgi:hypothetical protein
MVDIELLLEQLRVHGHTVGHWRVLPDNAGHYEMEVDGELITIDEARALLEVDEA